MSIKTILAALVSVAAACHALGAVYYAKPEACGAGDGSDWDNAMTFAQAFSAAMTANDGSEVRLAHGVYAKNSFYDGTYTLSITGGWRGESGTDETRDVDLYETIVMPTATIPTWEHLTPTWDEDGKPAFVAENTGRPIIADGRVSLPPAYTSATDTYRITGASGNLSRPFMTRGGALAVDGVWFAGWNVGTLVHNYSGTHAFSNCRFVGFLVNGTGDNSRGGVLNIRAATSVVGCKFLYVYGTAVCSALYVCTTGCTIENCAFEGCSYFGGDYAGGNVISATDPVTAQNCTFRRCHELSLREGQKQGLDGINVNTGNIYGSASGTSSGITMTDCTVSECYTASVNTYGGTPLVFGCVNVTLTGCTFANNVSEVRVRDGYGYPMIGRSYGGYNAPDLTQNLTISGCVFRGNTNRAAVVAMDSGSYALGIVGNGINSGSTKFEVTDTVFDRNGAEALVDKEGVIPALSRGILTVATSSGSLSHTFRNLTFTGSTVEGVHDVVQCGAQAKNYALKFQNSIFEVTDANRYDAFLLEAPQKVTFENTTVLGLTADYQDEQVTYMGLETDFVPLDGTYAPTVRTPGLSTVTTKEGISNRGAVQGVKQPEGTWALTVRPDPVSLGTIKPTTALAVGADAVTVTAEPVEGASVTGWYDTDGQQIGTGDSLTVTATDLGADTAYVVKFDKAQVALTFDLGEHARFKDSGEGTRVVPSSPGRAFPAVADEEIELDEGYVMTGWLPTFPSVVPETAATYAAQVIYERDVRIVRYDSNNTSKAPKDGLTWATAFTSFKDAMAAASQTYSEIWVKAGMHKVADTKADTFVPRDHMVIRGGYIGDDADDAARGDEPSVLDGAYAGTDSVTTMFDLTQLACDETTAFDSLTFRSCNTAHFDCGPAAHPLFTNCTFTGNARISASGSIRLVDCTFKDAVSPSRPAQIVNISKGSSSEDTVCRVERCVFDGCRSLLSAPLTGSGIAGVRFVVTDTVFTNCLSMCYPSSSYSEANACSISAYNAEVTRCRFVGNKSQGGGAVICVRTGFVADSLFAGNELYRYAREKSGDSSPGSSRSDLMTRFSVVPFSGDFRMERCTVVSNIVDCTVPEAEAADDNDVSLFHVNAAKALLVNNTVFGNTVTASNAGAGKVTASVFFLTGNGMGAAVNNTFYGNVAADGELLVSAARTVTDDFGDFNNLWAANAAQLAVKKAAWIGDMLTVPVRGPKAEACGKDVYLGAEGDTGLYVDDKGSYVKLPECTSVAEPALGDLMGDILGAARPSGVSVLGSLQQRIMPGLLLMIK